MECLRLQCPLNTKKSNKKVYNNREIIEGIFIFLAPLVNYGEKNAAIFSRLFVLVIYSQNNIFIFIISSAPLRYNLPQCLNIIHCVYSTTTTTSKDWTYSRISYQVRCCVCHVCAYFYFFLLLCVLLKAMSSATKKKRRIIAILSGW